MRYVHNASKLSYIKLNKTEYLSKVVQLGMLTG